MIHLRNFLFIPFILQGDYDFRMIAIGSFFFELRNRQLVSCSALTPVYIAKVPRPDRLHRIIPKLHDAYLSFS
jgi:hypothetical protein